MAPFNSFKALDIEKIRKNQIKKDSNEETITNNPTQKLDLLPSLPLEDHVHRGCSWSPRSSTLPHNFL